MILEGGITEEEVEDALVQIARHIPVYVHIGRPVGAKRTEDGFIAILNDDGDVWFYGPDNIGSWVSIGDQWAYTEWRWRIEVGNYAGLL